MKAKKDFVSKRLTEVWSWKEAIGSEVKDLPTKQALKKILRGAHATAKKYNVQNSFASTQHAVRESHEEYKKKKNKRKALL